MDLVKIAGRIAESRKEEPPPDDVPKEEEIKWNTLPKYQRSLKILVKDLGEAIRDKKNVDVFRIFGEITDKLGMMAKATGQRNVMTRLDTVEKMFES